MAGCWLVLQGSITLVEVKQGQQQQLWGLLRLRLRPGCSGSSSAIEQQIVQSLSMHFLISIGALYSVRLAWMQLLRVSFLNFEL